jgi:hypothetical protein
MYWFVVIRNLYGNWIRNSGGLDHSEGLGADGRIILK